MGKHPLNRTKEVSVNVVPSVDANTCTQTKWYVDEMFCRRSAVSMKCYVDEVLCRRSAVSTTCYVDEMFCRQSAVSTKCYVDKCCVDEMLCRQVLCRRSVMSTKGCVDKNFSTISCRPTACRQNFVDQQHIYHFFYLICTCISHSHDLSISFLLSFCYLCWLICISFLSIIHFRIFVHPIRIFYLHASLIYSILLLLMVALE
jgi:hypothetical protein